MPARNSTKQYFESGYYHLYNRGIEKRKIFLDEQDYHVFLSYLKEYLTPKDEAALYQKISDPSTRWEEKDKFIKSLNLNNFYDEIYLLAFCLMPNHFHLLLKQKNANSIDVLMNSLGTRYTMYFNKKYKRIGKLYQGVYKAVLVDSDEQLLQLTRYIHRQAIFPQVPQGDALKIIRQPSSYENYLRIRKIEWVKSEEILSFFSKENSSLSYESFLVQNQEFESIYKLKIESEEDSVS